MTLFDWLPFVRKSREQRRKDTEELRKIFAERYNHFRELLRANRETHDLMAEMEDALRGNRPYGIHYVQGLVSRLSTSVYQIIRNLDALAPGRYSALVPRYNEIAGHIGEYLNSHGPELGGPLILFMHEINRDHADLCGPKMSTLGEASAKLDMRIADGFVVTSEACRRFMEHKGLNDAVQHVLQQADLHSEDALMGAVSHVMQMVIGAEIPPDVESEIYAAYDALSERVGSRAHLAVRSSALCEDAEGSSFAGQYRSILNVDREGLLLAVREVMASKFSLQAMTYRLNRGMRHDDIDMCIGCHCMVDAESGGVAYSRNPLDFQDTRVQVHSVWGLPKTVVDGTADADIFFLDRGSGSLVERRVMHKEERYDCLPREGICRTTVNEAMADEPSLSDVHAEQVGRMALEIEEHFGAPQDVEWAFGRDGLIYLLQCRVLMNAPCNVPWSAPGSPEPILLGGMTASPGKGGGQVFVVRKDADAIQFPSGAVLVMRQALPGRATLLNRAAAVITEQGGVAGHLANVSRELGVPALFGMKAALDVLRTGDSVTVDADGMAVYPGLLVDNAEVRSGSRCNLMQGSPMQTLLSGISEHVLHLNLLDPESPEFRPENCSTFHDLMRFCHEKSVLEMFEFSSDERFSRAASRRLVTTVPMQFWVLNLADGYTRAGVKRDDGLVLMSQITCRPMRALWEGMMAVPWEGPPPVNARGLLAVMFEATMNADLEPTRHSSLAQKNYFMISSRFCSLQSRFGFHFCGAEAVIGDQPMDNYASFQFKGGAANLERRILRARFVAEILEEFDFRARLRQDSLIARLDGLEAEQMEFRLRALGYVITHTRQMDMIMSDKAAVQRRREKFLADIEGLRRPAGEK